MKSSSSDIQSLAADTKQQEQIRAALPALRLLQIMAETFKVLSDPTRLKLISALNENELCVGDVAAITGISQSSASHHLKALRQMNLVNYRRFGKMTFYALADSHVSDLLALAKEHSEEL